MKHLFTICAVVLGLVAMPTTIMSIASRENAMAHMAMGRTLAEVALFSTVACIVCGFMAHAWSVPNKRQRLLEEIELRYGIDWHRNDGRVERAISYALGGMSGIVTQLAPHESAFRDSKSLGMEWSVNQVLYRIGLQPIKNDAPLIRAEIHKTRIEHGAKWELKTFRVSDTAIQRFQAAVDKQRPRDPRMAKPKDATSVASASPAQ